MSCLYDVFFFLLEVICVVLFSRKTSVMSNDIIIFFTFSNLKIIFKLSGFRG